MGKQLYYLTGVSGVYASRNMLDLFTRDIRTPFVIRENEEGWRIVHLSRKMVWPGQAPFALRDAEQARLDYDAS